MTRLERGKHVRREVAGKRRDLVVQLTAEGMMIREKGRRTWYGPLEYDWLLQKGAEALANQVRREKLAARKARRKR